jgi:flagellar hook-associated protein 3 FlgL
MANASQNAQTRAATAAEVGQLLDQAIALANSQVGGRYVFAGYQTGTTPFVKFNNGTIDTAQYLGDPVNDFQIAIDHNENLTVGRNGQAVFMVSGLFDTLGNLKKALEGNDTAGIQSSLDGLDNALDHINNQMADIGARANRLEMRQGILDSLSLDFTEQLSLVEDADLAELSIELNQVQLAYQAVLLSTARLGELSLTNYL